MTCNAWASKAAGRSLTYVSEWTNGAKREARGFDPGFPPFSTAVSGLNMRSTMIRPEGLFGKERDLRKLLLESRFPHHGGI